MNRRSFLGLLGGAAAAMALPDFGRPEEEVTAPRINPAWEDAPYEMAFISFSGEWLEINAQVNPHPLRFEYRDGEYIPIPREA